MGDKISGYPVTVVLANVDKFDVSVGPSTTSKAITWGTLRTLVDNLYNVDGTLAGNREVTMATFSLGFTGGSIGIGTAAPAAANKLEIHGTTNDQTGRILLAKELSGANRHILYDNGDSFHDGGMSIGPNAPSSTIGIDVNGSAFTSSYKSTNTHVGSDVFGFFMVRSTANAGFDAVGISLNITGSDNNYGITVLNGFSGFGTATPTAEVHIAKPSGFRYVDGTQASGRVLTSDATGVASWIAVTGGIYSGNGSVQAGTTTVTMLLADILNFVGAAGSRLNIEDGSIDAFSTSRAQILEGDQNLGTIIRDRQKAVGTNSFLYFEQFDSTNVFDQYAAISSFVIVNTTTVQDGGLRYWTWNNGAATVKMTIDNLGNVDIGSGTITQAGARLFVKGAGAGGGTTALFENSSGTNIVEIQDDSKIAFFAGAVAGQIADSVALVDNSGGTANDTIQALTDPADAPATADALRDDLVANLIPELRNNFADLAAKSNLSRDAHRAHSLMA